MWAVVHHELRVLGRHRALRHAGLGDPVPVPLALPARGLPHRRGDDGVRRADRRAVPAASTSGGRGSATGCSRIPNQRGLWPNFRSPLEWDVFAVTTYLTISSVFFLVGLIPDAAARARPRQEPAARSCSTRSVSFGWSGANDQWKHYYGAYLFFAAMATPLVFSVHSVVSWDFAMAQDPGLAQHAVRALLRGRRDLLGRRAW